jgi:hypothetical protein
MLWCRRDDVRVQIPRPAAPLALILELNSDGEVKLPLAWDSKRAQDQQGETLCGGVNTLGSRAHRLGEA